MVTWALRPNTVPLCVAVNVRAFQFRQADFVAPLMAMLICSGANLKMLELKLIESLPLDNVNDNIDKMSALKSCGIGFSLDDVGSIY